MNISYKDMKKCLVKMVRFTIQQQKKQLDAQKRFSTMAWAKEMATIKFCLPRQSGHSTMALDLVRYYLDFPIYIVPSVEILQRLVKGVPPEISGAFVDVKNVENRLIGTANVDSVIVDCASLLSKTEIDKIYKLFEPYVKKCPHFIFIFLE